MPDLKVTAATLMTEDRKRVIMEYQVFNRQPRIAWRLWEGVLTHLVVEPGYFSAIQEEGSHNITVLHPPQVCLEGIVTHDGQMLVIIQRPTR